MKKLLVAFLILLLPNLSFAAISVGNAASGKNGSGSSLSYSMTVSGLTAALIVTVFGPTTDLCPSTVSWNGNTLNQLGKVTGNRWEYVYGGIVGGGTGNVSFNCTGSDSVVSYAQEYDAVLAMTNTGGASTQTNTATSITMGTTTLADGSWVLMSARNPSQAISAGSNTTLRYASTTDTNFALLDEGPVSPAGSVNIAATAGASVNWQGILVILTPSASSGLSSITQLLRSFFL